MTALSQSPIASAIAALEEEKTHLAARGAKVDEAIATLRGLFHLPAPATKGKKPDHARVERASRPGADATATAIRSVLARGPLSPGKLADAIGLDIATLRYQVRKLEQSGAVITSGTTASRRVALAGPSPAKEAP